MSRRRFESSDYTAVKALVFQRALLTPTVALINVFWRPCELATDPRQRQARNDVLSFVAALYGLSVFVQAAEKAVGRQAGRLRTKLWSLVCVLAANLTIFKLLAAHVPNHAAELLAGGCYGPVDVIAAQFAAATTIVLVPLTVYLRQAFPAAEAANASQDTAEASLASLGGQASGGSGGGSPVDDSGQVRGSQGAEEEDGEDDDGLEGVE
mmetsp:Transcript_16000/g.51088  ORF Transcript_16000/g.51088 Transcript_16000/m.51088 type:complete len:210 (-) Transcript_16000:55-684(-)